MSYCMLMTVLMSETIGRLRNMLMKWKEPFESKDMKVYHGKTMVMVSGGLTKDGMFKSKIGQCGVCSL